MAVSSTVQYQYDILCSDRCIYSAPANTPSHTVGIDIQTTGRLEKRNQIEEGEVIITSDRIVCPPFNARVAVPLPLFGGHHLLNELLKLNIDRFTCKVLATAIVSYVIDSINDTNNKNNKFIVGFELMAKLEVTRIELTRVEKGKFDSENGNEEICDISLEELTTGIECNRMTLQDLKITDNTCV